MRGGGAACPPDPSLAEVFLTMFWNLGLPSEKTLLVLEPNDEQQGAKNK